MNVVDSSGWLEYIILAAAREYKATVWTQDEDFKGLEGVRYFPKK